MWSENSLVGKICGTGKCLDWSGTAKESPTTPVMRKNMKLHMWNGANVKKYNSNTRHFSHSRSHFYFFVSASSTTKVMEKCATFFLGTGRVANSISSATESLDGYTIRSVKHSMQHARLTVTVPARRHHCTLVNTKLYCLVTVIHECE